jgi:hypothetical protein
MSSHCAQLAFCRFLACLVPRRQQTSVHFRLSRIPPDLLFADTLPFHFGKFCFPRPPDSHLNWTIFQETSDPVPDQYTCSWHFFFLRVFFHYKVKYWSQWISYYKKYLMADSDSVQKRSISALSQILYQLFKVKAKQYHLFRPILESCLFKTGNGRSTGKSCSLY